MTSKQAICTLILFILGSSLVVGINTEAKQDSWIAILIAVLEFIPMFLTYCRILSLYPGQNLYDIVIDVFGRTFGRIISFLYVFYSIFLGAILMRNFSEFIQIAAMPETPQLILLIFMFAVCVWMLKSGVEILGKWSRLVIPIVIIFILVIGVLGTKFMNLDNIKPIGATGFSTLFHSSVQIFSFPFTESVLFATLFDSIKPESNAYKIYITSTLISALIFVIVVLRNTLILGVPTLSMFYFPSFSAVSVISLANFISRFEVLIGIMFILCGFVKICVCMFSASIGIAKIIKVQTYQNFAVPVALLSITLAGFIFSNMTEMYTFSSIYVFFACPFEVILPLATLVGAEIKTRMRRYISSH